MLRYPGCGRAAACGAPCIVRLAVGLSARRRLLASAGVHQPPRGDAVAADQPAGRFHSTGLGVDFMGWRGGVIEGVELDEQAVDGAKLLLGDALAGEQPLQAVPPVAGRQKRPGGIDCQRCAHHTLNVRDFLVEKADHGVPP